MAKAGGSVVSVRPAVSSPSRPSLFGPERLLFAQYLADVRRHARSTVVAPHLVLHIPPGLRRTCGLPRRLGRLGWLRLVRFSGVWPHHLRSACMESSVCVARPTQALQA